VHSCDEAGRNGCVIDYLLDVEAIAHEVLHSSRIAVGSDSAPPSLATC